MSGYSGDQWPACDVTDLESGLISKPFTKEKLLRAVGEALSGPRPNNRGAEFASQPSAD